MADSRNIFQFISSRMRGFTIVELLVTVTLVGILLAMAVPSFRSMMVGNRLTTQANEIIAAMNLARSEAVKRNTSVSFCRATAETAVICAGSAAAWQFWVVRSSNGDIVRRGTLDRYGNTISVTTTLTNDEVVFGSDGLARTGNAIVTNDGNTQINLCASNISNNKLRRVVLGSGSRMFSQTGNC